MASADRSNEVKYLVLLGLSILIMFSRIATVHAKELSLETDRQALEKLKVAVDPSDNLLPWVSGTNSCTWIGVECSLPANTLGDLDHLRVLSPHHNRLTGPFPVDLLRCTRLQGLFLNSNLFSDTLPDFTGYWPRVSLLTLASNNFTGPIPASINALQSLIVLEFENNSFSGQIPEITLANLVRFSVANNNLSGSVPASLHKFPTESFDGNEGLCGAQARMPCPESFLPAVSPTDAPAAEPSFAIAAPIGTTISETTNREHKKVMAAGMVGIIIGACGVVILVAFFALCRPRHNGNLNLKSHAGKLVRLYDSDRDDDEEDFRDSYAVRISCEIQRSELIFFSNSKKRPEFRLDELLRASAEVLGKGWVGTSYRAELDQGFSVVVKRLKVFVTERRDFETHVRRLGRLRHKNLAPLRAYYFSKDEKLLVADYVPRGSLHALLHGDTSGNRTPVDWVTREKIALGCARAVAHLHKESVNLVNGNIKSTNVLLNRDLEPCVSDYCLTDLTPVNVSASGLGGYRAPEVTDIRKNSTQSDVYSFGVLLLELLTGKPPIQSNRSGDSPGQDLTNWVLSIVRNKWTSEVFDAELLRYNSEEEMQQMLQLALACVDSIPERRPKMDEVVLLLEDITQLDTTADESSRHAVLNSRTAQRSGDPHATALVFTRPSSGVFVIGD
uniref:Protein kinase domain-containing protein n=1 Tax=Physcomitrium patens TaxID=3218 RepID=A0A7I4AXT3_PHYPA